MDKVYLITSEQLQNIFRYLMTRPYGEVVQTMNMLSKLEALDPRISKDFVKKQKGDEYESEVATKTTK
ncbi:hypothetical protein EB169_00700 [archaeon]|jgi:hypothetical protein|nr:hypothetical protein [archaeon]